MYFLIYISSHLSPRKISGISIKIARKLQFVASVQFLASLKRCFPQNNNVYKTFLNTFSYNVHCKKLDNLKLNFSRPATVLILVIASIASLAESSNAFFSTVSTPIVILISMSTASIRRGKNTVQTSPSFQLQNKPRNIAIIIPK